MSTVTLSRRRARQLAPRLGPADHGRELTYEEFLAGEYEEGHRYELIAGRLYVSPMANYPHEWVRNHIYRELTLYMQRRPNTLQQVLANARVFVPGSRKTTCPEPDFAIYRTCPPGRDVKWQDISPLIVVEIVSADDAGKDYVRNVALYQQVPSIREYWVFDRCAEVYGPTLRVYSRANGRQKWKTSDYGPEDVYSTKLLPGLKLPVCPPR
jgi:Uma2 family endonuclease